ncbi:unnamed protein product [Gordionus sp. m RMFG-2023]
MATILALGFAAQVVLAALILIMRNPDSPLLTRFLPNTFIKGLRSSSDFRNYSKLTRNSFYWFMILILAWDILACVNFIFWPVLYFASPIMGVHSKLFMTHIAVTYWPIEQLCASNVNWLTAILSLDRMISIAFPLTFNARFVGQNSRAIVSVIFFITLVGSIPYLLPFKVETIVPRLLCLDYEDTNVTINIEKHFDNKLSTLSPSLGITVHNHKPANLQALKATVITMLQNGENFYLKGGYHDSNALVLVNGADFPGDGIRFNSFDNLCLIQTKLNNFTVECILITLPKGYKYVVTKHYTTWNPVYDKVFSVFMYLIPVIIFIFCNTYMLFKLATVQRKVFPTTTADTPSSTPSYAKSDDLTTIGHKSVSYEVDRRNISVLSSKLGIIEEGSGSIEVNTQQSNTVRTNNDDNQKISSKRKKPKSATLGISLKKKGSSRRKMDKSQTKSNRNITKLMMFLNIEFLLFNLPYVLFIYVFNHAYVEVGAISLIRYQVLMNALKYGSHGIRVYVNFLVDKNIKETLKIIVDQMISSSKIKWGRKG